jgi:hypothetical protein
MSDNPGGIIPPFMSKDWQLLRSHLRRAAELATKAAEASTPEEVRRGGSAAQAALMDADFTLRRIERNAPRHNVNPSDDTSLDGLTDGQLADEIATWEY